MLCIDFTSGEKEMKWEDDSNLNYIGKQYKKYYGLENTEKIDVFISERVINREREDAGIWLSQNGAAINDSDLDIFIKNHGCSINDVFWINDTKDNHMWYDVFQYSA